MSSPSSPSPYQVLSHHSLSSRCRSDIKQFRVVYSDATDVATSAGIVTAVDTELVEVATEDESRSVIHKRCKQICDECGFDVTKLDKFDYRVIIAKQPPKVRERMWVLRTCLFYQILSCSILRLRDVEDVGNYQLGIFGSITPTSDIDVGIQYGGLKRSQFGKVISAIEDIFVEYAQSPSLSYDIELFANFITAPNPDLSDLLHPDIFYLDTTNLTKDDFRRLLPYAGASIVRNLLKHPSVVRHNPRHVLRQFDVETYKKQFGSFFERCSELFGEDLFGAELGDQLGAELGAELGRDWLSEAKHMVLRKNKLDYDQSRREYYRRVDVAERAAYRAKKTLYANLEKPLGRKTVMRCLVANAEADLYREGSYLLSPTVMHIVRVLQPSQRAAERATPMSAKKYKTTMPRCGFPRIDPVCSIGQFGYLLSIIEQHGYVLSFDTDIVGMKKRKKYTERADNAMAKLLASKDGN